MVSATPRYHDFFMTYMPYRQDTFKTLQWTIILKCVIFNS